MAKDKKGASKAQENKDELIHRSKEPHDLACKLTDGEISTDAKRMADVVDLLCALSDEKKTALKAFAERNQRLDEELKNLGRHVKDGTAIRSVPCELQLNYTTLNATLVREDTMKMVGEPRPMTEDEKQMEFDLLGDS